MRKILTLAAMLSAIFCATDATATKPKAVYPINLTASQYQNAANDPENPYYSQITNSVIFNEIYTPFASWYDGADIISIRASSRLASQGSSTYLADNAHDFNHDTAWCEGVNGYGIGEYLVYTFPANHPRITTVKIVNGYAKNQSVWLKNSRVKKLAVYYNDSLLTILELENSRSLQIFDIGTVGYGPYGAGRGNWTLRFEIMEVYPGTTYQDTLISELLFDGIDVY